MKITVMLPTCDAPIGSGRPHYWFESCLRSVQDGGYPNFECLVGCDGDSPKIEEAVRNLGDPRFRYLAFPRTRSWGNFQCHEMLEKHATGDVVMWLNHDDSYAPNALLRAAEYVECFPGRPIFFKALLKCGVTIWQKPNVDVQMNVHVLATVTPRIDTIPPYGTSAARDSAEDFKWVRAVANHFTERGKPPVWAEETIVIVRPWAPAEFLPWMPAEQATA